MGGHFAQTCLKSAIAPKPCQLVRHAIPAEPFTLESVLTDFVTISSKLPIAIPGNVFLERYNNLADIG
jgi:hypothetical protein